MDFNWLKFQYKYVIKCLLIIWNLMVILNAVKVGIIYGLIVDAFKLGS